MHSNVLRHVAAVFMLYGQFQLTTVRLSVPMLHWMRRLAKKWHWKWQHQIRTVMTLRWAYSQGPRLVQLSTQIPGTSPGHQAPWRPSTYRNDTFDALRHIGALLLVQILHCTEGIHHAFKLLHMSLSDTLVKSALLIAQCLSRGVRRCCRYTRYSYITLPSLITMERVFRKGCSG